LLLLPSTLLWTSGIIKEPLLLIGIGLLTRALIGRLRLTHQLLFGALGILIMAGFKPYVLVCFVPAILVHSIFAYLQAWIAWTALSIALLLACLMVVTEKAPSFVGKLSAQQNDFI